MEVVVDNLKSIAQVAYKKMVDDGTLPTTDGMTREEIDLLTDEEEVAVVRAHDVPEVDSLRGQTWEARRYRLMFVRDLPSTIVPSTIEYEIEEHKNRLELHYYNMDAEKIVIGHLVGSPAKPGFLTNGLLLWGASGNYKYNIKFGPPAPPFRERAYSTKPANARGGFADTCV